MIICFQQNMIIKVWTLEQWFPSHGDFWRNNWTDKRINFTTILVMIYFLVNKKKSILVMMHMVLSIKQPQNYGFSISFWSSSKNSSNAIVVTMQTQFKTMMTPIFHAHWCHSACCSMSQVVKQGHGYPLYQLELEITRSNAFYVL